MEQPKLTQSKTALVTELGLALLLRCCSINYSVLIATSALTPDDQRGLCRVRVVQEHGLFSSAQPQTRWLMLQQPDVTWAILFY